MKRSSPPQTERGGVPFTESQDVAEPERSPCGADTYRFSLFGRFVVRTGNQESLSFEGRKVQELLAYLVLFPERPHHRDALAEVLWGAEDFGPEPRKQLRQALWHLRLAFRGRPRESSVIHVDGEWLQANDDAISSADVWQLKDQFSDTKGVPGEALGDNKAQQLRRAADLYRADLLEGWYRDWCVYERERLRTIYLSLLEKLLAYCEARERPEEGLFYGERILAHDRAHERTHWRMMRMHLLAGDRTRALQQYRRCAVALREELGIAPSGPMVALMEKIRGGIAEARDLH